IQTVSTQSTPPFQHSNSQYSVYTYLPAFKQYGGNAKVVHFLGQTKPWSYTYDPKTKRVSGDMQETSTHTSFLLDWWFLYSSSVVPMMVEDTETSLSTLAVWKFITLSFVHLKFQSPVKENCDHHGHWPGSWSQINSHKEGGWKGNSSSHDSHHTEPYMSPETSEERKQKWEQGQADYMGMDSFDNIQKKLDAFLK
ncbi:glycogenin-1-like, partial [Oncorhynchus masou masou]|uniref:glycogenin-1-like n=1 Tax=Oncorhynchus masou masou TaxID=90313 RepID=UPI00318306D6